MGRDQAQATDTAKASLVSKDACSGVNSTWDTLVEFTDVPVNTQPPLPEVDAMPANIFAPVSAIHVPIPNNNPGPDNMRFSPKAVHRRTPPYPEQPLKQASSVGSLHNSASSGMYNWVNPQLRCCCHVHMNRRPGQRAVWQGNFWQFISYVLDERFDWTEDVLPANDVDSEDLAVRAVVEGWDAVAQRGPLHPSWHMLRRIDEAVFGPIAPTERLAMLRAMHLLIQYHTEPSPERYSRLPPWYIYRPSQHVEHTYAIDYYAWPTFRQRFILNPHAYCGNDFFSMYQKELQLLWPFAFRDCYTHDLETGLYKPSRLFDERMNDIRCWTMGRDFFQQFPELSSDIAASVSQVPRLLPSGARRAGRQLRLPRSAASTRRSQFANISTTTGEEPRSHEQDDEVLIQTEATHEFQLRPHLTPLHDKRACALPPTFYGYDFQEPVLGARSCSSDAWYSFSEFGSDCLSLDAASIDAAASRFMGEAPVGSEAAIHQLAFITTSEPSFGAGTRGQL